MKIDDKNMFLRQSADYYERWSCDRHRHIRKDDIIVYITLMDLTEDDA